jgi:O-antigen/teichoic acid export membrane protein
VNLTIEKRLRSGIAHARGGKELSALIDQALVSGANFITNVLLARSLGVREFGVFALAWSVVLFANSLQVAFIISPMMSVGPKQGRNERPDYYGSVIVQEIAFAFLCSAMVLGGVFVANARFPLWNIAALPFPLAIATVSYLLQDFIRRYLLSVRRAKAALLSDATSYLIQVPIIALIAHRGGLSPSSALLIVAGTSFAGFLTGCIWLEPLRVRENTLKQVLNRHWNISRWLAPSAFMQWSSGNLFALAAPVYFGPAAAGILRVAQNIVGVTHIWYLGLDNIVPAETARRLHSDGLDAAFDYIKQILWRWGVITLLFLTLISLFPQFWLSLIYGAKYAPYGGILRLYAAMYFMVFFANPLRAGLQALEYTAPVFWSYSAMTVFSLAFAGPLAKRLGLVGILVGLIAVQLIFQGILAMSLLSRIRRTRRMLLVKI